MYVHHVPSQSADSKSSDHTLLFIPCDIWYIIILLRLLNLFFVLTDREYGSTIYRIAEVTSPEKPQFHGSWSYI